MTQGTQGSRMRGGTSPPTLTSSSMSASDLIVSSPKAEKACRQGWWLRGLRVWYPLPCPVGEANPHLLPITPTQSASGPLTKGPQLLPSNRGCSVKGTPSMAANTGRSRVESRPPAPLAPYSFQHPDAGGRGWLRVSTGLGCIRPQVSPSAP